MSCCTLTSSSSSSCRRAGIEHQNEFVTEGGKLHDAVKGVMESTEMLSKTVALAETMRMAVAR